MVEIPYSTFYQQVEAGNVKDVVIAGQEVTGEFKQAVTVQDTKGTSQTVTHYRATQLPNGDPHLVTLLNEHQVEYQAKPVENTNLLLSILINVLPCVLLFGFFYFMARRATQSKQGLFGFGKSRAKVILIFFALILEGLIVFLLTFHRHSLNPTTLHPYSTLAL